MNSNWSPDIRPEIRPSLRERTRLPGRYPSTVRGWLCMRLSLPVCGRVVVQGHR